MHNTAGFNSTQLFCPPFPLSILTISLSLSLCPSPVKHCHCFDIVFVTLTLVEFCPVRSTRVVTYRGEWSNASEKVLMVKGGSSWEINAVLNRGGGGEREWGKTKEIKVEMSIWRGVRNQRREKQTNAFCEKMFVHTLDGRHEICVKSQHWVCY